MPSAKQPRLGLLRREMRDAEQGFVINKVTEKHGKTEAVCEQRIQMFRAPLQQSQGRGVQVLFRLIDEIARCVEWPRLSQTAFSDQDYVPCTTHPDRFARTCWY